MKVLLVDGFARSVAGRKKFALFVAAVKEAFARQKLYTMGNIEFAVVDGETVEQYLSELNTGYLSKDSEKVSGR